MDEVSLTIRRARRVNSKNIELSNRALTSIPQDLLKITTLESLNLSHNMIVSIPENITDLENLTNLDLSFNEITSLPTSILLLPLVSLLLQGNPINFGNQSGPSLKSAISALFSGSKPQPVVASTVKRPGTSAGGVRPKREEEKFSSFQTDRSEPKNNTQGVTRVEYTDLSLGEIISQGGFSVVHKAMWKGTRVAAKVIVDPVITPELRAEFENEIMMLNYLRHPSTVLLMAVSFKPPHFIMVSEFVQCGTLFEYLHKSREEVSLDRKLSIINQICTVFLFYHSSGVVHRDLKSMNVLLTEGFSVKICDFGLARFKTDLNRGTMQFSGTPAYMAPELFRKVSYDEKVDVFAFGTLVWEIMARKVPYDAFEPGDIREKVLRGDLKLDNPVGAPRKVLGLIEMCRKPIASERPGFEEISHNLANL